MRIRAIKNHLHMDAKKNPIIPEKIDILQISITYSSINSDPELIGDSEIHGFDMNMGHDIAYNFEGRKCRVRLRLEFGAIDLDHKHFDLTANFNAECHFKIDNMGDCIKRTKKGIQIDKILPATLLGMAYSTLRGVILERTSNTLFSGLIMPVINPMKVLDVEDYKLTHERNS